MSKAIGAERPAAGRSRKGWKPMAFGGRAAPGAAPEARDPANVPWYRIGGIAALALSLGYLATIVLFARVGAPPTGGGEAWMQYLPGKTGQWWAILALSVVTDLLYIPVAFALFLALKRISHNAMLIAVALTGLFVVLDLAVTWTNYAALITLGGNYASTANAAQRASDTVAAGYPAAVVGSRLESVYAIVVLSSAILIVGLVMMRGVFNRGTAYVGVLTGALGILAPFGWSLIVILNAIGTTAWIVLVSYRLAGLGWERRWRPGRLFTLVLGKD